MVRGHRDEGVAPELWEEQSEEGRVDRFDVLELVLVASVVRGDVGSLDVDVEAVVLLDGLKRRFGPDVVLLLEGATPLPF